VKPQSGRCATSKGLPASTTVTIKPAVSAANLKTAISAALVRNAQLEGKHITVTAHAGVVTLEGTVRSSYEQRQANNTAWSALLVS
jgi:osmotically-inducible protein OsmY